MRGRYFVLKTRPLKAALREKQFDSAFCTMYKKGGTQIPKELAVKFSQSKVAMIAKAKEAKNNAKRFFGNRSPRYRIDRLSGAAALTVSVIDDVGFNALTALREGVPLKHFKEMLRITHAKLGGLPFWVADPIRQILGHWFRTLRRAEHAVAIGLDENDVLAGLFEPT